MEHVLEDPTVWDLEEIRKLHWGWNIEGEVSAWGSISPNPKYKAGDTILLVSKNVKMTSKVIISDEDSVLLDINKVFELDGVKYSTQVNEVVFTPVKCETCVPEDHSYCSKCPTCHKKGEESESIQETTTS